MKKTFLLLSMAVFAFLSTQAAASLITIEQRTIDAPINDTDFAGSWLAQTTTISSSTPASFTNYFTGNNVIARATIDFTAGTGWGFQAGLDGGYGAAFYLDGSLIENRTDDLWWSNNWNSADVISTLGNTISAGAHVLELYWAEGCCSGANSARFTTDGGTTWQTLSVANLDAAAPVPAPSVVSLLALGLLGLVASRRLNGNV